MSAIGEYPTSREQEKEWAEREADYRAAFEAMRKALHAIVREHDHCEPESMDDFDCRTWEALKLSRAALALADKVSRRDEGGV